MAVFIRQVALFRELLEKAFPDKLQEMDPSFSLTLGEMFSIVAYAQLIIEQEKLFPRCGTVEEQKRRPWKYPVINRLS